MRIRDLDIESYGIYSGRKLALPSGFALVCGPNEAGKSTLLELLREILFDFRDRGHPYAFPENGEMAATASAELADGRQLRFRRRKGRKDRVAGELEGASEPLDEAGLERLLEGATLERYRSLFAFSLTELSGGQESLREGDLREALFGSGSGDLMRFQRLAKDLQDEEDALYSARGKKPEINRLVAEVRAVEKRLREAAIRPQDYERRREVAERLEADKRELESRAGELKKESERLDKLQKARPKARQLRELKAECGRLEVPVTFPAGGALDHRHAQERVRAITEDLERIAEKIAGAELRRDAQVLLPELIDREGGIRGLHQQIGHARELRERLPGLEKDEARLGKEAATSAREIRAGWEIHDVESLPLDLARRESLRALAESRAAIEANLREVAAQRPEIERQVVQVETQLEELEAQPDVEALAVALERASGLESDRERLEELSAEARELEHEVSALEQRLRGSVSQELASLTDLPVPLDAEVVEFRERLARAAGAVEKAVERRDEAREALAAKRRELDEHRRGVEIPERSELERRRGDRDRAWRSIRRHYVDGTDADLAGASGRPDADANADADEYESSVRGADELADEIVEKSELVAGAERLEREMEDGAGRLELRESELAARQEELERERAAWAARWQRCELTPSSPAAMSEWLSSYRELEERRRQLEKKSSRAAELRARGERIRRDIESALDRVDPRVEPRDVDAVIALARSRVDRSRAAEGDRARLSEELPALRARLEDVDCRVRGVREELVGWEERWRAALEEAGFDPGLEPQVALKVLDSVQAVRRKLAERASAAARAAEDRARLGEFEASVRELCSAVASDLTQRLPEDAAAELHARLEDAILAERQRAELTETLSTLRRERAARTTALEAPTARLAELRAAAEVETDEAFEEVAERANRREQLLVESAALERELAAIRAGEEPREFFAELAALENESESETLEQRSLRAREELRQSEEQYRGAVEESALVRQRLEQLDRTSEAAEAAQELEEKRAELAAAVERWATVVLAQAVVRRARESFERDHRPELLAEVARLLGRLTGGRWVRIERRLGEEDTLLVADAEGRQRTPDQLSRGAREQLYLAIRLAYIRHYCKDREPLPVVMDDVLVNFDDERARHTLEVLAELSREVQVVFLTCHETRVEMALEVIPELEPVRLEATGQTA